MEIKPRNLLIGMLLMSAVVIIGGAELIEISENDVKIEREKYIHTFAHPMYEEKDDGTRIVIVPVGDVLVTYYFYPDGDDIADFREIITPEYVQAEKLEEGVLLQYLTARLPGLKYMGPSK